MHIEQHAMFVFKFPYDGTEFTIPVRAPSKDEAVRKLQQWMSQVQVELAMELPSMEGGLPPGAVVVTESPKSFTPGSIPDEVLEMRIDTLLKDLGAGALVGSAKSETIKKWTKLDFVSKNYPKIITKLELISAGEEEAGK